SCRTPASPARRRSGSGSARAPRPSSATEAVMAIEAPVDVALLKSEIKKTYASVSKEPEKDFIFPTGRAWAEDLDYPPELAQVPDAAAESFAGIANPFSLGRLERGERVLDLGSGAGTDSLVAALMVGPEGSVTGVDMTPEMLERARGAAAGLGAANVAFVGGEAEAMPLHGPRSHEWRATRSVRQGSDTGAAATG